MAVLSDSQRREAWAEWMRGRYGAVSATKGQVRAAVDAVDEWVYSSLAAFLATIPEAARSGAAPLVLLANIAAIGRGSGPADVAAGIADRSNPAVLLEAYNSATAWLTANTAGLVAAAGGVSLSTQQLLSLLETVCRKRAAAEVF